MPWIIFRYLTKELFFTTSAITGVLFLIISSSRFSHYLNKAVMGSLNSHLAMMILLLKSPSILSIILPLALFLGVILTYGRMSVDHEMHVLNSTGISQWTLTKLLFPSALIISGLVAVFTLWVTPVSEKMIDERLNQQKISGELDSLQPKSFQPVMSDSHVIYFESYRNKRHVMANPFIAMNKIGPNVLILADYAYIQFDKMKKNRHIILNNGVRYDVTPGQGEVTKIQFEQYGLLLKNQVIFDNYLAESALSVSELLKSHQAKDIAELQWRVSLPLMTFIVVFLAVPLSYVKPRRGRFVKIFPSILIYLLYLALLMFSRNAVASGEMSPIIGVWWAHIVFFALGLFLLFKEEVIAKVKKGKKDA